MREDYSRAADPLVEDLESIAREGEVDADGKAVDLRQKSCKDHDEHPLQPSIVDIARD